MSWSPDAPRPGYWMVRCCRRCAPVAAMIGWTQTTEDPHSGEPMDRSPILTARLGLEFVNWREVWVLVEYLESSPEQQRAIANPPISERPPRHGRGAAFIYAAMPKWQQQRALRITPEEYQTELAWLRWAQKNAPTHHDYRFRRPVNPATAHVPRFA